MELVNLQGESRATRGSRAATRLRKAGKIPGIVYGHGEEPLAVAVPQHELEVAIHHGTRLLELDLGGNKQRCLVKEVQYDHLGTTLIHVDLARVSLEDRVRVKVSVELRGTPKGAKEGGVLEQVIADLEVECLVTEIPENLRVDVSAMEIGNALHISDIPLPEGVKAMVAPELVVCTVRPPLAEEEAVAAPAAAEGEAAAAEPEVIGRKEKAEAAEEPEAKEKK